VGNLPGVASRHWRFAPDNIEAVRAAVEPELAAANAALNASARAKNVHVATRRIARRWPGAVPWMHAPTNHEYLVQCEELTDALLNDVPRSIFLKPRRDVAASADELPMVFNRRGVTVNEVDDSVTQSERGDDGSELPDRHNRAPVEMERDLDALESVEDAFSEDDEQFVTMPQSAGRVRVLARSLAPPSPSEDDDEDSAESDADNEPFTWRPLQLTKRRRM
jgi:hypothetical protein